MTGWLIRLADASLNWGFGASKPLPILQPSRFGRGKVREKRRHPTTICLLLVQPCRKRLTSTCIKGILLNC